MEHGRRWNKGVNGSITASAGSGDQVEVTAEKKARRSDPDSVEVKVLEHAGGVTICAVYPSPSGDRPNECAPGEGGRMSTRDNDVSVSFTVRVPAGVRFVGRTVNGGIEARHARGRRGLHGSTARSRWKRPAMPARTVNGSITAEMGRADWQGAAELSTVNGSITVALPANAGADVEARTVNGSVENAFPLSASTRQTRRRLSGTIGGGGRKLELETVNGSIHLARR